MITKLYLSRGVPLANTLTFNIGMMCHSSGMGSDSDASRVIFQLINRNDFLNSIFYLFLVNSGSLHKRGQIQRQFRWPNQPQSHTSSGRNPNQFIKDNPNH